MRSQQVCLKTTLDRHLQRDAGMQHGRYAMFVARILASLDHADDSARMAKW